MIFNPTNPITEEGILAYLIVAWMLEHRFDEINMILVNETLQEHYLEFDVESAKPNTIGTLFLRHKPKD